MSSKNLGMENSSEERGFHGDDNGMCLEKKMPGIVDVGPCLLSISAVALETTETNGAQPTQARKRKFDRCMGHQNLEADMNRNLRVSADLSGLALQRCVGDSVIIKIQ